LAQQKQDLEKALSDLSTLTKDLEEKIQAHFARSLKEISELFSKYVAIIFGGGNAKLREEVVRATELSENNSLEDVSPTGIDVSVSLPRKKIKSIEMLSGGERALASMALLFAIVGSSAPPFLILDEVDAALDETNSGRFAKLLQELSGKTQFILITHNRATMEAADILYGVTMEEGASKIFSLKFEEAEKVAAKDIHPEEKGSKNSKDVDEEENSE
jgi:chromosome segregation protein